MSIGGAERRLGPYAKRDGEVLAGQRLPRGLVLRDVAAVRPAAHRRRIRGLGLAEVDHPRRARIRWRGTTDTAMLLGLGGWFAGALIVLTTMPGVPLDGELLAVLAVGVPVGPGIYWAWVNRDWSPRRRRRDSRRRQEAPSSVPGSASTRPTVSLLSSPRSSERPSART